MNVSTFIALRFFITRKKKNAIHIISGISMGVFLTGAAVMIIILSLLNGLENLVKSSDSAFDPDLRITIQKGKVFVPDSLIFQMGNLSGITAVSRILEENVVLRYSEFQEIARIKGVDQLFFRINKIDTILISGSTDAFAQGKSGLVGVDLANRLNIHVDRSSVPLEVMVPRRGVPYNALDPGNSLQTGFLRPDGILLINKETDVDYLLAPLDFTRELLGYTREVSALEIDLSDEYKVSQVKTQIREMAGDAYYVWDRYEQNETAYRVFKSEKWMTLALLSLILVVAAFNAIGALTMLVLEKRRDLVILRSMGMRFGPIRRLFIQDSVLISAVGGGVGILLGLLFCTIQHRYGIIRLDGAMVESFPVDVRVMDVLMVYGILCALGLLAGLYPSVLAVRLSGERMR